jgi:hypothetical protein
MAVEHRMDGAFGRNPDITVEPPDTYVSGRS